MRYAPAAFLCFVLVFTALPGAPLLEQASAAAPDARGRAAAKGEAKDGKKLKKKGKSKRRKDGRRRKNGKKGRKRGKRRPRAVPPRSVNPPLGDSTWGISGGSFTLNGQPAFPRGFYYVSYYEREKDQRLTDLQRIAEAGFNLVHTPIDTGDAALMQRAKELGVHVMMEFNDDPQQVLSRFASEPALGFIGAFDDVDYLVNGAPKFSPAHVAEQTSAYKRMAPRALTYISGGNPQRIKPFAGTSDALGYQSYPIPFESLGSVTSGYIGPMIGTFLAAQQPVIANLQTFGWEGRNRYPTPSEVRNMTYQALIAGVKGVLYYAYHDQHTDLNKHPALWAELNQVGVELGALEPYLAGGAHRGVATNQPEIYAAAWRLGSEILVAVVNTSGREKQVALDVGEALNGSVYNVFNNRPGRLSLQNGKLSGAVAGEEVQVYMLGAA